MRWKMTRLKSMATTTPRRSEFISTTCESVPERQTNQRARGGNEAARKQAHQRNYTTQKQNKKTHTQAH
jgi:hypothetical protein